MRLGAILTVQVSAEAASVTGGIADPIWVGVGTVAVGGARFVTFGFGRRTTVFSVRIINMAADQAGRTYVIGITVTTLLVTGTRGVASRDAGRSRSAGEFSCRSGRRSRSRSRPGGGSRSGSAADGCGSGGGRNPGFGKDGEATGKGWGGRSGSMTGLRCRRGGGSGCGGG